MEILTAMIVLCATACVLWGATALVWLTSEKPLISVTIQTVNQSPPAQLVLKQSARQVFA